MFPQKPRYCTQTIVVSEHAARLSTAENEHPKVYEELLSAEEFYKDKDYVLFIDRINGTSTFIPREEIKNDRN